MCISSKRLLFIVCHGSPRLVLISCMLDNALRSWNFFFVYAKIWTEELPVQVVEQNWHVSSLDHSGPLWMTEFGYPWLKMFQTNMCSKWCVTERWPFCYILFQWSVLLWTTFCTKPFNLKSLRLIYALNPQCLYLSLWKWLSSFIGNSSRKCSDLLLS